MLGNYFKIALRNILKSPANFIVNVVGLSIGMAACVLIVQFVHFETGFDAFHKEAGSIVRVVTNSNEGKLASTPVPVAPLLVTEFEEVELAVRFRETSGILETTDNKVSSTSNNILMTEMSFLEVFDFPLISGSVESLNTPGSIILSEEMANQYFGSAEVLGKELNMYEDNFGLLKLSVTGVLKSIPKNSHLRMDALISLKSIENNDSFWAKLDNWGWNDFYTYAKLKPGTSISESSVVDFLDKYIGEEARLNSNLEVFFQPIADIHLSTDLGNEYGHNRSAISVYFLLLVGIIILLMAVINYINLVTAKGFQRAKEVGIRKNLGANKGQLVSQFSFEALFVNLTAFLIAITAVQLSMPFLSASIGGAYKEPLFSNITVLLIAFIPVSIGILWSAVQPSLLIAAFSMNDILKGKVSNYGKGLLYRKGSVVVQFVLSLALMITSFIIYKQVAYFQNKDLGINVDQVIVVERPKKNVKQYDDRAQSFKDKLISYVQVEAVSASGSIPSGGFNWSTSSLKRTDKSQAGESEQGISITYIDNAYYDVYQPEIVAGSAQYKGEDTSLKALINESALAPLKFESADEAIDKVVSTSEISIKIIGVIKNYNHRSLKVNVEPALYLLNNNPNYFSIRYNTGNDPLASTKKVLDVVQREYKQAFPDNLYQYEFLDDRFERQYKSETDFGWVMLIFTLLGIFLAALGLFSLSAYNLSQRTKEVGVRKVLGANTISLLLSLALDFIKLIGIALLIAVPLAYYLGQQWLDEFANKIDFTFGIFLLPILALVFITLSTTAYHMMKLARINPVDSLRYE
ncbi:MAG: ABC transporter permease [Bacteroidota bacterium]